METPELAAASRVYLAGIGVALGEPCAISRLEELANKPQLRAALEAAGVDVFLAAPSLSGLVERSVCRTLEQTGLVPADVGNIVFTTGGATWSSADDAELLMTLQRIGFSELVPRGIIGQQCANFGLALDVAVMITRYSQRPTLFLTVDRVASGAPRVLEIEGSVSGDGASSCILSVKHGEFAILSHAVHTSPQLLDFAQQNAAGGRVLQHARSVRQVVRQLCDAAKVQTDELAYVMPPNINVATQLLVSSIVQQSVPEVASRNLKTLGHVQACDGLINLVGTFEAGALLDNELVLLTSVGLFGWSGVLMQKCRRDGAAAQHLSQQ